MNEDEGVCSFLEMEEVGKQGMSECSYVSHICGNGSLYINYFEFYFCRLADAKWVAFLLFIPLICILIYVVNKVTYNYLSLGIFKLADYLKCSDNLAGATILAFMNGINDLFASSVAAFNASKKEGRDQSGIYLAVGSLIGSSVFISMVIPSVIILLSPEKTVRMVKWQFIKDSSFLIASIAMLLTFSYNKGITQLEGLFLVLLYIVYQLFTVMLRNEGKHEEMQEENRQISFMVLEKNRDADIERREEGDTTVAVDKNALIEPEDIGESIMNNYIVAGDINIAKIRLDTDEVKPEKEEARRPDWQKIWFSKDDTLDLSEKSIMIKLFHYIIRVPVAVLLKITVPPPHEKLWERGFACITPVSGTLLIFFTHNWWDFYLFTPYLPVWLVALAVASILGLIIRYTTHLTRAPPFLIVFTLGSLLIAMHWLLIVFRFIIDFLDVFGFALKIPQLYLGMVFLAPINSLGDLFANLAVSSKGFPIMAITSTLSSPIFNMLIALGITLLIYTLNTGSTFSFSIKDITFGLPLVALVLVLGFVLELMLIGIYNNFTLGRKFAICGIATYVVYAVLITLLTFVYS